MAEAVSRADRRGLKRRHRDSEADFNDGASRKKKLRRSEHGERESRGSKRKSRRSEDHEEAIQPLERQGLGRRSHASKAENHEDTAEASEAEDSDPDLQPFVSETHALYLPVPPAALGNTLAGLCMLHLSSNLLKYYPPLSGILLSYSNPRLSEHPPPNPFSHPADPTDESSSPLLLSVNEYAVSYIWLTADFTVFRPGPGCWLEGRVNLVSQDHVGLILYNFFGAGIERRRLPRDWVWSGDAEKKAKAGKGGGRESTSGLQMFEALGREGWKDGRGERVQGNLRFMCKDVEIVWERENASVQVVGTLLEGREDERRVAAHRKQRDRRKEKRRHEGDADADVADEDVEQDEVIDGREHRRSGGGSRIVNGDTRRETVKDGRTDREARDRQKHSSRR